MSEERPPGLRLAGQRFLVSGLTRLTVRVARMLSADGAEVTVVGDRQDADVAGLLGDSARLVWLEGDREETFRRAGVAEATTVLALDEDDIDNLDAAVCAGRVAPHVPLVVRAFDPVLAEQLEEGLRLRRAYSVSALAAPAFVAGALAEQVLDTLRLADKMVPLCTLTVREGSPLAGSVDGEVQERSGCTVIAHRIPGRDWEPSDGTRPIEQGDQVLVGGLLHDVLEVAVAGGELFGETGKAGTEGRGRRPREPSPDRIGARDTLFPLVLAGLGAILVANILVFGIALHLNPIDALYFSVTTAFGDPGLTREAAWLKVFGVSSMVLGAALVGVLFTQLASIATANRLEERMGRRARRMHGHAILVGLGDVGYRVEHLLAELGVPRVGVDVTGGEAFTEVIQERTPVITGDVRAPETLQRAGVEDAVCLFALTSDDITNVGACLRARRANPRIRTVARIFDETLATRVSGTMGIDVALSATRVAASVFVDAAIDERASRTIELGNVRYLAFRHDLQGDVGPEDLRRWFGAGIRVLALRRGPSGAGRGTVLPPSQMGTKLERGDSIIVTGPEAAIRSLVPA